MQSRLNRQDHPASELDLPLETLVEHHFGPADPRPVLERLGPLPLGAASLTLPLWACVLGKEASGWRRVGSVTFGRGQVNAQLIGLDATFEPAWRAAMGLRVNPGDAKSVAVFAVERGGRWVVLGQAKLTESLLFLGSRELIDSRRDHPLLGGKRR
ncbi:hypothetical protein LBMAG42_15540 [Deltaproteobacteria bacterium]|nr:hypothetical protein LBMAG42_15540 [Deltaproteobacteria bacterium]